MNTVTDFLVRGISVAANSSLELSGEEQTLIRSQISRSVFLSLSRERHGGWKGLDLVGRTYNAHIKLKFKSCLLERKSIRPGSRSGMA
jgi:hypothetical protein